MLESKLSDNERGEIAYALVRYKAKKEGLKVDDSVHRELGNVAKETGIPLEQLRVFVSELYHDLLRDMDEVRKDRQG